MGCDAAIAFSDHHHLSFLCTGLLLEKLRSRQLFLVDLTKLLLWYGRRFDGLFEDLERLGVCMSILVSAEHANYPVTRAANDIPVLCASTNRPDGDCRVGDCLYTLIASPYSHSTIFPGTNELPARKTCERVYEVVVAMKFTDLLAV